MPFQLTAWLALSQPTKPSNHPPSFFNHVFPIAGFLEPVCPIF